jgi:transposase
MQPMKYYIGDDAHKKYSIFRMVDEKSNISSAERVPHDKELYRKYLTTLPPGSPIAIESVGNWYWMIEAMEQAGHTPILVHPRKAKLLMGLINKTDKLDAKGLAMLNLNGSLPEVWIPPAELRDQRELSRSRMSMVGVRTQFKNRIQATLSKYAISIDEEVSDVFGQKGRILLEEAIKELPPETRNSVEEQLILLDQVSGQIKKMEEHIREVVKETPMMQLIKSLPGVGDILAITIALEIGNVERFGSAEQLASYSGTVPRVSSSGGKTHYGKVRADVNHYLKWAFIEAASCIALRQRQMEGRHVVELLKRIQKQKGYAKAAVAVGRHLAEATYCMLKRNEPYHEPNLKKAVSSSQG